MLQPASFALKFGFLAVLYLFLLWVAWSVLRDVRRSRTGAVEEFERDGGATVAPSDATSMYAAASLGDPDGIDAGEPRLMVDRAPGHQPGMAYDLVDSVTLGRGDVEIHLEDPFASSRHARIAKQGHVVVIEDLGSTNGTYLNDEPLSGPQPLHAGDRIRIGDSEFTYQQ
ncbi:MAG TPA: FHA domain-containing protein [Solirubrobacteraceae bacterium]